LEHVYTPSSYSVLFGPIPPVLKVKPGDVIRTETLDAFGNDKFGRPVPEKIVQSRDDTFLSWGNPLVGPFYVEGAEVGDTLIVHLEEVRPNRETALSAILPNFGSLTEEVAGRKLLFNEPLQERWYEWKLDLRKQTATLRLKESLLESVEIPLHPFIGAIGVAPRFGRIMTSADPGEYGGNMDCVETKEGTTLYLPVFVRGAYLAFGDVHAAQGDGELTGCALDVSADVKLRVDVAHDKAIEWPRLEDENYIMTVGSSRPLMEAMKLAHIEMVSFLMQDYGFDKWEALQILSQVGLCRIGNIVDPNYTVVVKFPKKYLPT